MAAPFAESIVAVAALTLIGAGAVTAGYEIKAAREARAAAIAATGSDPDGAPPILTRYGCAGCHDIPGIQGPGGRVGPPLRTVKERVYLGGRLTNTPDNLVQWIANPRQIDPKTAMPVTGISTADARHVAAYLLALQ